MIKLTITEKGGEPRPLSFDQNEVSIGRVQGNDIVLAKGNISKRHSRLTLADGRLTIVDLKSTNGSYVNGRKIAEAMPLRPGDKIFVGDFLIVVEPTAAGGDVSASGSRRGPPPPPPPPPPRPGSGVRAAAAVPSSLSSPSAEFGEPMDSGRAFGDPGDGPGTGRGRPPAPPPPPPPRRTLATTALQDDSADMGGDEAPPSPDEVDAGMGDLRGADQLAAYTGDGEGGLEGGAEDRAEDRVGDRAEDGAVAESAGDAGNDVFGSHPANDEDSPRERGFRVGATSPVHTDGAGFAARHGDAFDDQLAGVVTPVPTASSRPSAAVASASADVHGHARSVLEGLLADPAVNTVVVVPGGTLQVDRAGKIETMAAAGDGNAIAEIVWQIANTAVPPPPSDNPVVDVRLLDGTRLTALFPPITSGSVAAVIRKAHPPETPLADLAGSSDVETILRAAIASRRNLLLAGDTGAVATLLAAIGEALPAERRVISVGAGAKARPGWIELGLAGEPSSLARAAVAFRAEHLLFADAGGAELPELLVAAARGQEGMIVCLSARSAAEALARLRAFTVGALGAPGFSAMVASTVDMVVVAGTTTSNGVRVLEIAEPQVEGEALAPTFVARRRQENGRTTTTPEVLGVSGRLASAIAASADGLPAHLIRS